MDYYRPSTPQQNSRVTGTHPHSTSRSWHGASSRRSRRNHRSRRAARRRAKRANRPRNCAATYKDINGSPFLSGSRHSPSYSDYDWQAPCFSSQPRRIPQIISPNTREKSFTEILNGAFDPERSPLSLGKKLANGAGRAPANWARQDTSRDGNGSSSAGFNTTPTPMRPPMETHGSLFGQPAPATYGDFLKPEVPLPSAGCFETQNSMPFPVGRDNITVGIALAPDTAIPQALNFDQLLQMIQHNTAQSKQLYELLATYLKSGRVILHGSTTTTDGWMQSSSNQMSLEDQSNVAPQVSALACGGDSPDKPRDNTDPCRGHMIDRMDSNMPSSVEAGSTAHSAAQSEAGWGSSAENSLFSLHRDNHFFFNPTLSPISLDSGYQDTAGENNLWGTIRPSLLQKSGSSTSDGSSSRTVPIGRASESTQSASCRSRHAFAPSPDSVTRQLTINTVVPESVYNPSPAQGMGSEQQATDTTSLNSFGFRVDNLPPAEPVASGDEMEDA